MEKENDVQVSERERIGNHSSSPQVVVSGCVGKGEINYDLRRISELASFPKPWYRASVARRIFFGDKYMNTKHNVNVEKSTGG